MTRSIAVAILSAVALAACQRPFEPPPVATAPTVVTGLDPYCGPVWSDSRQGYVELPCPGTVSPGTVGQGGAR